MIKNSLFAPSDSDWFEKQYRYVLKGQRNIIREKITQEALLVDGRSANTCSDQSSVVLRGDAGNGVELYCLRALEGTEEP